MYCKYCGSVIDNNAKYCINCGKLVERESKAVESVSAVCDGTPSTDSIINDASESIKGD